MFSRGEAGEAAQGDEREQTFLGDAKRPVLKSKECSGGMDNRCASPADHWSKAGHLQKH